MVSPELLAGTVLARNMTPEQVAVLSEHGVVRMFEDGEQLLSADEPGHDLVLVLNGSCVVRGVLGDVVGSIPAGSLVGEMSFIDKRPRSASVYAKGTTTVAIFPENLVDQLRGKYPDVVSGVALNIAEVLCIKLRQATRLIDAANV